MDSRRSLLVLALLFISFLVYQQWQLDKNPPVQQQTTEQTTTASSDVPASSSSSAEVVADSQTKGHIITLENDVFRLKVDTLGGDVISSELLKYDAELKKLLEDKEYALKVFGIERGNKKPRKDISKWSDVKENISYMYDEEFAKDENEYPYQVINDKESISKILKLYVEKYYDENDDKQAWFDKIKELAGKMGYAKEVKEFKANPDMYKAHVGDVSTVLRIALTKRTNTPDMYEIMQILGKDRMAQRFNKAI